MCCKNRLQAKLIPERPQLIIRSRLESDAQGPSLDSCSQTHAIPD